MTIPKIPTLRLFGGFLVLGVAVSSFHLRIAVAAPNDLNRETELSSSLETFLVKRIQRIVKASGVRGDDFSASAIVHLVKQAPPSPPDLSGEPDKTRTPATASRKKNDGSPNFMTFGENGSFMDADQLVRQYEQEEASDQAINNINSPSPAQPKVGIQDQEMGYNIEHVYVQAALSERLDPSILPTVEKALHASFDPIFGSRLAVDVKPYLKANRFWYESLFHWLKSFQWLTMEALALLTTLFLFLFYKLIPSWQAKQPIKSEHSQKEEIIESPHEPAPSEEPQLPEPSSPGERPVNEGTEEIAVSKSLPSLDEQIRDEIRALESDIITFANKHPKVAEKTAADCAKNNESASKIGFYIEFLSRQGVDLGHIKMRADMINELREWRKKHDEISPSDRLKLLKELHWDLAATEHLAQETSSNPLEFLTYVEDRILAQAMKEIDPASQARILGILDDKRSARLIDRLSPKERGEILERLLGSRDGAQANVEAVAKTLADRVKEIQIQQSAGAKPSAEVLSSILRGLAFESQFLACRTIMASDSQSLATVLETFFNVGLLPKVKNDFLAKLFIDRPREDIEAILAQFDPDFRVRVVELLPPMQQRMMEGRDFSRIPRGTSMTALKALNDQVLEQIAVGKVSLRDIFETEMPEGQWTENAPQQAA